MILKRMFYLLYTYFRKLRNEIQTAKETFRTKLTWEYAVHIFVMTHQSHFERDSSEYTLVKCLPLDKTDVDFDNFLKNNLTPHCYWLFTTHKSFL